MEILTYEKFLMESANADQKRRDKKSSDKVVYITEFNEDDILSYFEKVGITEEEFNMQFESAENIPWEEGDILPAEKRGGRTFYRYRGKVPAQRKFCREMLNLNRLYTYAEIKAAGKMNDINPEFGPSGGDGSYDIWLYKGGVNCKHYWEKVYATFKGVKSKGPAVGKPGQKPINWENRGFKD